MQTDIWEANSSEEMAGRQSYNRWGDENAIQHVLSSRAVDEFQGVKYSEEHRYKKRRKIGQIHFQTGPP